MRGREASPRPAVSPGRGDANSTLRGDREAIASIEDAQDTLAIAGSAGVALFTAGTAPCGWHRCCRHGPDGLQHRHLLPWLRQRAQGPFVWHTRPKI